jgi:hypothetical protein
VSKTSQGWGRELGLEEEDDVQIPFCAEMLEPSPDSVKSRVLNLESDRVVRIVRNPANLNTHHHPYLLSQPGDVPWRKTNEIPITVD